jgi:hypothetical protein
VATIILPERVFLDGWKSTDFSTYNETEVREEFIIHLLHALGWRKGTTYDLEMEKSVKLSAPYHQIGRKEVVIDYAPSLRKRYFWIIEAKPGKEKEMRESALLQAHLYAVHPEIQARMIVLTSGWEVRVYDALTVTSWNDPLLVVKQGDGDDKFIALRDMVGAENMLAYQRMRLIDIVRTTLETEVDLSAFDKMAWQLKKLTTDGRTIVQDNARKVWLASMKDYYHGEKTALEGDSIEVVMLKMDFPTDGRPPPVNEYVRRVRQADPVEQARLVDLLAMNYRGRPHNVFRTGALRVLVDLAEAGVDVPKSSYVNSVQACISELALANSMYWTGSPVLYALCHLDNISLRTTMRLCLRQVRLFEQILGQWKATMSPLDLAKVNPSLDSLVYGATALLQEIIWSWYCRALSAETIWEGIWSLQAIEAEVEKMPDPAYRGEELDLNGLAHFGRGFDQLIAGTWSILTRKRDVLKDSEIDPRVRTFVGLTREQALAQIPPEPRAPDGWVPTKTLADIWAFFEIAVRARLEAMVVAQLQKR